MISFRVEGIPKAQPRPKFTIKFGKVLTYVPQRDIKSWVKAIKYQAFNSRPKEPIDYPVELIIKFYMPRPSRHYSVDGKVKSNAPYFCDKRPDLDNLLKLIIDVLTQSRFWTDDSLIVRIISEKLYSFEGFTGALVEIKPALPVIE